MIVTLINKKKRIDEKRRDLLRHVNLLSVMIQKQLHVFKGDINKIAINQYCRVLHEMESIHSANWFFWLGETSSTDGLKGESFIS